MQVGSNSIMILSSTLLEIDNNEIGLLLDGSSLIDPFGIATMLDAFKLRVASSPVCIEQSKWY